MIRPRLLSQDLWTPRHQGLLTRHGPLTPGGHCNWLCTARERAEGTLLPSVCPPQPYTVDGPKIPAFSFRVANPRALVRAAASFRGRGGIELPTETATAQICYGKYRGSIRMMALSSDEQARQHYARSCASDKPRGKRRSPPKVLSGAASVPIDDDLIDLPKLRKGEVHALTISESTTIERYKQYLREYVALRSELQTWCEFFLSRYHRRPTLVDAESTRIPWLASKFREYVAVRQHVEAQAKRRPQLAVLYVDARRKSLDVSSAPIEIPALTQRVVMNATDLWIDESLCGSLVRDADNDDDQEEGEDGEDDIHEQVEWHTVGRPVLGWARKRPNNNLANEPRVEKEERA